jgi:hypothetical protein
MEKKMTEIAKQIDAYYQVFEDTPAEQRIAAVEEILGAAVSASQQPPSVDKIIKLLDLVEPIARAICKVEALDPDEPTESDREPNWVRYADAIQQALLAIEGTFFAPAPAQEPPKDECESVHQGLRCGWKSNNHPRVKHRAWDGKQWVTWPVEEEVSQK